LQETLVVRRIFIAFSVIWASFCSQAHAAEGPFYGGPVGGTDIRNAYLPPNSGFYGTLVGGTFWSSHAYNDNGNTNGTVQSHGDLGIAAFGLMYVYPFHLFGGTLASSVQDSVSAGYLSVKNHHDYFRGFGDLYADIFSWSKYLRSPFGKSAYARPGLPYGLTVKLAYSMIFPTGKYNTTQLSTSGHNVFIYIPNFAVTYLTGPNFMGDGLEFSVHVFFDIVGRNSATNYSTGSIYDIDAAISERVGRWQVGVQGYYARQWEDDIQNGQIVAPNGKRLVAADVGPVVSYDIPQWKSTVKLKIQLPVYSRNTLGIGRAFVIFTKAF
jgi:hypothetical protein